MVAKEKVNGSGGRGVVREREDEDDDGTDCSRGQRRRTDGDEGVEIAEQRETHEKNRGWGREQEGRDWK